MTTTDPNKVAAASQVAVADVLDFSASGVLARLRATLAGWVTALTGIAVVIFGGLSLGEYVKAPASADPRTADIAQLCLLLLVLGVILILGASGLASAMRAAPQDGAFKTKERDPLRFFPRDTAPELLQEYKDEVSRFNAARLRDDLAGMQEATYWMNQHSQRLWDWLEAYRARQASRSFKSAATVMAVGALLTGLGTIGFADALRRMKSAQPDDVIVQGPKNGTMSLRIRGGIAAGGIDPGLEACMTKVKNGALIVPVTVMSVKTPTAEQKTAGVNYVASVVPPMTMIPACVVKVYDITSKQASVLVAAEAPEAAPAVAATTTATAASK